MGDRVWSSPAELPCNGEGGVEGERGIGGGSQALGAGAWHGVCVRCASVVLLARMCGVCSPYHWHAISCMISVACTVRVACAVPGLCGLRVVGVVRQAHRGIHNNHTSNDQGSQPPDPHTTSPLSPALTY